MLYGMMWLRLWYRSLPWLGKRKGVKAWNRLCSFYSIQNPSCMIIKAVARLYCKEHECALLQ